MTRHRSSDRIVDFTEEFLANIPQAKGHTDLWYDRQQPYMFARRGPYDPSVTRLGIISGRRIVRGALMNGVKINRLGLLPKMPLAEARTKAAELWAQYKEYEKSGKVTRGGLPRIYIPGEGKMRDPHKMLNAEIVPVENPDYDSVMSVLMDAFQQLSVGKGKDRHGHGLNFEDQDMLQIMEGVGINFALGQAMKKILEGRRLKMDKAREEFLGAIIYMAGAVVWLDQQGKK